MYLSKWTKISLIVIAFTFGAGGYIALGIHATNIEANRE